MAASKFTVKIEPRPKKRPKVYRWSTVNPSEEDEQELAEKFRKLPNCPEDPLNGQIRVEFKFYKNPPKSTPKWKLPYMDMGYIRPNKSPDLDNYMKLVLDALNGILWEDDRYIVEMHAGKFYTTGDPKIEILVDEYDPPRYMDQKHLIVPEYSEHEDLEQFFEVKKPENDDI